MDIENEKIYYIALYFEENKIHVFLNDKLETNDNNSNKEYDIIQIGHNKTDKIYFCGEIGPFFLLKNLEGDLNNISRMIKEIMKLKDKYPDFIYLMNKEANYDFSYLNKILIKNKCIKNYAKNWIT